MRPAIRLADREQRTGVLPADSAAIELEQPTLFLWAVLAGLSLILGLTWRLTGRVPAPPDLLDAVNLALWLTAPWLALAWDRLLRRQDRHVRPLRDPWAWRLANASYLLFAALLLSMAPTALLLGFNIKAPVAQVNLEIGAELNLPTGIWLLMSLMLVGPIAVITSTVLLHLARVIAGWRWGLAGWLLLTVVGNAPLVLGGGPLYILDGEGIRLPFTIGQYATWAAMQIAATESESMYLHEMIGQLVMLPCAVLLAGLIVATVFQRPVRRLSTRIDAVWLVAVAAIVAVAARGAWQGWLWAGDPTRTIPGNWLALFYTGMAAAWLIWCLLLLLRIGFDQVSAWRAIGWLGYTALAWFCLTLAHRFAGQVETATLLTAGAVAMLVTLAGLLLLYRASALWALRWCWVRNILLVMLLAGLVLPLPLAGRQVSLVFQAYNLLVDDLSAAPAGVGYYALPALALFCIMLWPYGRRRRPRRTRAAEPAGTGE